jgi:hypothetical protein
MTDRHRSLDSCELAESLARCVSRETACFACGVLIVVNHHGQAVLFRSRPVDDLFLQAVQRRLLLSYQLYVGPALTEPEIQVTVYGDSVAGPYEPPRSLLTVPLLSEGRVVGVIAVASVFPEAFSPEDLCTLSALAAWASEALPHIRSNGTNGASKDKKVMYPAAIPSWEESAMRSTGPESRPGDRSRRLYLTVFPELVPESLPEEEPLAQEESFYNEASCRLASISELAQHWKDRPDVELPEALRRDLDAIAQHARYIRKLVVD